eukprot:m.313112 g.313112  ORF g.313112 m.313112 type:complete len:205 (-) comp55408_c0_seq6:30-644(-)
MCWLKAPIPRRKVIGARFIWVHQANAPGLKSFALCSCVVWLEEDRTEDQLQVINETKNVQLSQRTPIRVLHRRSLADRERCVFNMSYERIKPHFIKLRLSTQAGTYVKEFVHGDFGRTVPSLSSLLGTKADILSLDVEVCPSLPFSAFTSIFFLSARLDTVQFILALHRRASIWSGPQSSFIDNSRAWRSSATLSNPQAFGLWC